MVSEPIATTSRTQAEAQQLTAPADPNSLGAVWSAALSSMGKQYATKTRCALSFISYIIILTICFGIDYSFSEDLCEYPDYFGNLLVSPDRRAGEFYIGLTAPDPKDSTLVQKHLVFSTILARFLGTELRDRTQGLCEGAIWPSRFPDLRAFIFVAGSSKPSEVDRSLCRDALRDVFLRSNPSKDVIAKVAASESALILSKNSHYSEVPAAAAHFILNRALASIYYDGTVMHSLVSVDARLYEVMDGGEFLPWFGSQRSSGVTKWSPIPASCVSQMRHRATDAPVNQRKPQYSLINPAELIKVHVIRGAGMLSSSLRYMLVVGFTARPNEPILDPATQEFCNREHSVTLGSDRTTSVLIRCLSENFYEVDSWRVFFCEPREDISEIVAKQVMMQIASDPNVLALAQGNVRDGKPRGPYLVEVQVSGE